MALFITFKSSQGHTLERQFHVGSPLRERFSHYAEEGLQAPGELLGNYAPVSIFADGDELEYIRHNYKNIPMTAGRTCQWFGDTCRFILANWSDDDQHVPSKEGSQPPGTFRQ